MSTSKTKVKADPKSKTPRSDKDLVVYEIKDGIAWVKWNRPEKRNAQSPAVNRRMMKVIDELEFRDDFGVLVLTGEGTSWNGGMDLKEYFRETEATGLGGVRKAQREAYGWWGTTSVVPKTNDCNGQRVVLWRCLWATFCLRPRLLF